MKSFVVPQAGKMPRRNAPPSAPPRTPRLLDKVASRSRFLVEALSPPVLPLVIPSELGEGGKRGVGAERFHQKKPKVSDSTRLRRVLP